MAVSLCGAWAHAGALMLCAWSKALCVGTCLVRVMLAVVPLLFLAGSSLSLYVLWCLLVTLYTGMHVVGSRCLRVTVCSILPA